jgi:ABC-type Fe3+ transport system permease subunit
MTTQALVYSLCLMTGTLCAVLLARSWLRTKRRFLLWCAVSFALLAVNNALVLTDMLAIPHDNLIPVRQAAALGAVVVLIYGFMWEID